MKDTKLVVGLLALALLAGCGSDAESTVSGLVTLDGAPLDRGNVTFYPIDPTIGRTATGSIQPDGQYTLRVGKTGGLNAGEYDVAVVATEPSRPSALGGPPAPGKLITPRKYKDADKSGFNFQVAPGSNEINLELISQ